MPQHAPTSIEDVIRTVARKSSALAVDCSDTAGLANKVATVIAEQGDSVQQLRELSESLMAQHDDLNHTAHDARQHMRQATVAIDQASQVISRSIAELGALAAQVADMGHHAASVQTAIEKLDRIAASVSKVAKQSRILALNANIEAARAGEHGLAFGTVAHEMGLLARNTEESTREVGATIAELRTEAATLIGAVEENSGHAKTVGSEIDAIFHSLDAMRAMIEQVDSNSGSILDHGHTMLQAGSEMRDKMVRFAADARENSDLLSAIYRQCERLELEANEMLDLLANSGTEIDDTPFMEKTIGIAREIERVCEAGVARGEISLSDIFDTHYRAVPGTDPEQFTTRFCDFADAHIRPILDRVTGEDKRMIGCVISDLRAYLPTHLTLRSQPQGRDGEWNDTWCRNRRFLMDPATQRSISSDAPAMLTCYRMPLGGEAYLPIKSIFAPIVIGGRRWGQYEFSYVDNWNETAEALTSEGLQKSLGFGGADGDLLKTANG